MDRFTVREFTVDGEVLETAVVSMRGVFERSAVEQMRDEGFVPILDVNPKVFTHVEGSKRLLSVTVFGAFVGDDAWGIEGVSEWKTLPRTHRVK